MKVDPIEPKLERHPFAQGLAPMHVQALASCMRDREFRPGETLVRQGEDADEFYLIQSGDVALEIAIPYEGTVLLETVGHGEVLGWSWIVAPYRWRFDARALTKVKTLALDGKCLRAKCQQDKDLGYELLLRVAAVVGSRLDATRLKLMERYRV